MTIATTIKTRIKAGLERDDLAKGAKLVWRKQVTAKLPDFERADFDPDERFELRDELVPVEFQGKASDGNPIIKTPCGATVKLYGFQYLSRVPAEAI